jgi:hypothetical protein
MSIERCAVLLVAACAGDPTPAHPDGTGPTEETDASMTDTGTPPTNDCVADWEVDRGHDGFVDGIGRVIYDAVRTGLPVHTEIRYSDDELWADDRVYDADGFLVRFAHDEGQDGTPDFVSTYVRDGAGHVLVWEVDDDGNGIADEVMRSTWDEDGHLVTYTEDEQNDGAIDYAYTNVYDEHGLRSEVWLDEDGDGEIDVWYTYTRDEIGRWVEFAGDRGHDGTIDWLELATYTDPVLYVGSTVVDRDNDGDPEFSQEFTYDAALRPLLLEDDEDADGFLDRRYEAVYDPTTDLLVTEHDARFTPPPDDSNRNDVTDTYAYDDEARLVEHTTEAAFLEPGVSSYTNTWESWTFGGTCP